MKEFGVPTNNGECVLFRAQVKKQIIQNRDMYLEILDHPEKEISIPEMEDFKKTWPVWQ